MISVFALGFSGDAKPTTWRDLAAGEDLNRRPDVPRPRRGIRVTGSTPEARMQRAVATVAFQVALPALLRLRRNPPPRPVLLRRPRPLSRRCSHLAWRCGVVEKKAGLLVGFGARVRGGGGGTVVGIGRLAIKGRRCRGNVSFRGVGIHIRSLILALRDSGDVSRGCSGSGRGGG